MLAVHRYDCLVWMVLAGVCIQALVCVCVQACEYVARSPHTSIGEACQSDRGVGRSLLARQRAGNLRQVVCYVLLFMMALCPHRSALGGRGEQVQTEHWREDVARGDSDADARPGGVEGLGSGLARSLAEQTVGDSVRGTRVLMCCILSWCLVQSRHPTQSCLCSPVFGAAVQGGTCSPCRIHATAHFCAA